MGRRWGKSVLGGNLSIASASQGANVGWVVPTYKNGRTLWRWADKVVSPLKASGKVKVNQSERTIEFSNGGFFGVFSADNPDSIRSNDFHLLIMDEAAMMPPGVWTDAAMPTLADHDGRAYLISSPKRKNWFWEEFMKGVTGVQGYASFTAPSSANPNPAIQRAAERAKDVVSNDTYRQEWLAEFLEHGGEVFRNVKDVATLERMEPYASDFVEGLDWAQKNDSTVMVVMDRHTRRVVDMDRFTGVSWSLQRGRVMAMAAKWGVRTIIAEENSIGGPNIEALQAEGLPVRPFTTTAQSKPPLIENLALAIERAEIAILNDGILTGELSAYERKVSPTTGRSQYSAPEGMHDDCVIALALAWWGVINGGMGISFA